MNFTMPLLSVIVTVYNTENYLNRCLDSILNCTYKNIELIVVDDESPGNIDEIMGYYIKQDSRIKYIKHEINKGLFHARITGVENSKGDFIAFLDSDDHVSCDFYRRLIEKAISTNSDMVIGEYYLEYEDGTLKYQNLAHTRILDIDLQREEAANLLFKQHGLDFSLHVVWNKIYSRKLWEKCYPYLIQQNKHLIMCEDILYSCLFYYFAEHITNIHGDFVYYVQNTNASTSINKDRKKFEKNINDLKIVFGFLENIFINEFGKYVEEIEKWKNLLLKNWKNNVDNAGFNYLDKKFLYKKLGIDNFDDLNWNIKDWYFYSIHTDCSLIKNEDIKLRILNSKIKVISFDIFDTLISRPFYNPTDLFVLLEVKVNNLLNITDIIKFKEIRIEAEKIARDKSKLISPMYEDVTLDDIYDVVQELTGISKTDIDQIKQEEINLELKYCMARNFAKELFDLAKYLGKKIIITSDMYLPKDVIIKILKNNGYLDYDELFLSSDINLCKNTGNLYKYIIKKIGVSGKNILHIGDNFESDVIQAQKSGWNSYHFPKAIDILTNKINGYYGGEAYNNVFSKPFAMRSNTGMLDYFGIRTMLAVVANKIFDNPFVEINRSSDFNADPRIIGYYGLGPHLYAIAEWLLKSIKEENYINLNFMARDGFLPMEAFKILNHVYKINININYLRLTRQSILPLQINSKNDFMCLSNNINIYANSPESIIKMFSYFVKDETLDNAEDVCSKNGFIYNKKFKNLSSYYKFIKLFNETFYDDAKIKKYKETLKNYLSEYYNGKTADFDIGYSCRIESVLKKNFKFNVTSYFIHINKDIALLRSSNTGVKIKTFFNYSPGVTGTVRELLISKLEPSCKMINFVDGKMVSMFKEYNNDYYTFFVINNIQKAALSYTNDIINIFKNDIKYLYYQREDMSMMHEYFNAMSKYTDRQLFSVLDFEDDFGLGEKVNLLDFWNEQTNSSNYYLSKNDGTSLKWIHPLWKRAICMYFIDRDLLKRKVENKLKNKPLQLRILKKTYKSLKWIYHKFKSVN